MKENPGFFEKRESNNLLMGVILGRDSPVEFSEEEV
jgi:hypothetical protein